MCTAALSRLASAIGRDELRVGTDTALLVVSADGGQAHGWERPTLIVGDEVWGWSDREPTLLGAAMTSLVKNPEARFFGISTAAPTPDTPLGRARARALALPEVKRDGALLDARGDGMRWLEWSVPEEVSADDLSWAKAVNPAPWITREMLAEQRRRVTEVEWLQFHLCRWHTASARWLGPGAWQECQRDYTPGTAPMTLGVDIGGSRSASALVGVSADPDGVQVELVEVRQGRGAVLEVSQRIRELAAEGRVERIVFDPMRFEGEAMRLESELGLVTIEWPQSEVRMTRCSENLHRLIVEGRLRHFSHPELNRHVANAIAKPTPRGWRLVKGAEDAQIDAVIALAFAAEVAERAPAAVKLLGWL